MSSADQRIPPTALGLRFEAAKQLGCEVVSLDPDTGFLNELRRGDARRILVGGLSPLNDAVAARLVGDKSHTLTVLKSRGFRTPESIRCLKPNHFRNDDYAQLTGHEPGLRFSAEHGYPLVVKPNFGSRGLDIACVHNEQELIAAIDQVWKRDYLALVQKVVSGFDLRIDFLDGEFLFGYTRSAVCLEGDGNSTLRQLLARADSRFEGDLFETRLEEDPIWQRETEQHSLSLDSIMPASQAIDFDTPIMNLNRLCVGKRVVDLPSPWRELGLSIGRTFSLRHFGIDLKIQGMDLDPVHAAVIEVNSSPSLSHMSRMGHLDATLNAEKRIVEAILRSIPQ